MNSIDRPSPADKNVKLKIKALTNYVPYPSYLILDFVEGKPIHVVFSCDESTDTGYVVTAYIPGSNIWLDDFKTRSNRS